MAKHFARLHHHASSGVLLFLQNAPNLFSILPPFFEKNRGSMRPTFSTTPPPSKFWMSTSPVTAASDLSIWRWASGNEMENWTLFLDFAAGASDLSFRSWAFGPAPFLIRHGHCFWIWMLGHSACHF